MAASWLSSSRRPSSPARGAEAEAMRMTPTRSVSGAAPLMRAGGDDDDDGDDAAAAGELCLAVGAAAPRQRGRLAGRGWLAPWALTLVNVAVLACSSRSWWSAHLSHAADLADTEAVVGLQAAASPAAKSSAVALANEPVKQANAAMCAVNVGFSAVFLGKAGLGINAAVQTCSPQDTPNERATCSASTAGLVAGFLYALYFMEAASANCMSTLEVVDKSSVLKVNCASDFSVFLGSLALAASTGSSMRTVCGVKDAPPGDLATDILATDTGERRLAGNKVLDADQRSRLQQLLAGDALNKTAAAQKLDAAARKLKLQWKPGAAILSHGRRAPRAATTSTTTLGPLEAMIDRAQRLKEASEERSAAEAETKANQASCAFDVGAATLFIARAGLLINSGVVDCSSPKLKETGREGEALCSVEVTSIIGAFAFVASSLSYAVAHCGEMLAGTSDALCAAAIIDMVGAVSEVAAAGSDFNLNCGKD